MQQVETARAADAARTLAAFAAAEGVRCYTRWELRKFEGDWQGRDPRAERYIGDALRRGLAPYEVLEGEKNIVTTAGWGRMLDLFIVAGGQGMDNAHCRIGAGNGSTAVAAGDTDLSAAAGSANRWFNMADATYPSRASNVLTVRSTFAAANGNFAWNEFGVDLGTVGANTVTAPLINHALLASFGTKGSATSWQMTATFTFT